MCKQVAFQLTVALNCCSSSVVPLLFVLYKGAFQKSELAGRTRHFGNEIGFFQDVLREKKKQQQQQQKTSRLCIVFRI